jgi:hypothetical protein
MTRSTVLLGPLALAFLMCGCSSDDGTPQPPPETPPVQDVVTGGGSAPPAADLYAWVQLTQDGDASVRAVVPSANAACPTLTVDGASQSFTVRDIPSGYDGFVGQVTVCAFPIAGTATAVTVNGAALPGVQGASDTVLVVGDTGCRLKHSKGQSCTGKDLTGGAWGFPTLSGTASKVSPTPDLILHVGDYLYRESEEGDTGKCTPYEPAKGWKNCGDNWPTWQDDWFTPAHDGGLMGAAPWVYVRGNHEDCNRGWQGYFLFFANEDPPASCPTTLDPYVVSLDDLDVYVVDSSDESSTSTQANFTWVAGKLATTTRSAWLTTHVPTYDLGAAYANSGLDQATALKWLHVGHQHNFQHIPAGTMQAQTVTGGSGTGLDTCSVATCDPTSGPACCYGKVSDTDAGQYSYLVATMGKSEWSATVYDEDGTQVTEFTVAE